ncbi:MAG: substrate-binding domain-containing protein [Deltaproteobacteria bacterium]|nr:substrate-binding domain-containing protein [Deltaproteobacteria bacterium]
MNRLLTVSIGMITELRGTFLLGIFLVWGSGIEAQEKPPRELRAIFPVTCVSPGLADGLAKLFEAQYKVPVKVYSLCTGDAIRFIKEHEGVEDVDVMIGHDYDAEERFVRDGYAVNLRQVCYSDFVLVGPPEDPAKIKGMTSAVKALEKIAKMKANFCSRADSSGTHALEMRIWKMAKIKPDGDWYIKTKVGTSETLMLAARKRAYFISQWATFTQTGETIDLIPLVDDKATLFTNYEVMAINPQRFPTVNYVTAIVFIGFLTSPDIQKYIGEFGIEKFHRPSFWPLAVKTNQPQKGR